MRASAIRTRGANDHPTNRWERLRRAHPPRRAAFLATCVCHRISRFLQTYRGLSKSASREHRGVERVEITRRARRRVATSTRPHGSSSPLPRISFDNRTARSASAERIRASNVLVALGFLGCEPGSVLGARRQVRPAGRRVRTIPCPRVPAAVCGISRRANDCGSRCRDHADLSLVQRAAAHGCAASGRRQRETVFALFVLLAGVGISADSLPYVRRTGRRQVAGLRGGAVAPHPRRSLRHLQILSALRRSTEQPPHHPPRRPLTPTSPHTLGPRARLLASPAKPSWDLRQPIYLRLQRTTMLKCVCRMEARIKLRRLGLEPLRQRTQ